MKFRYVIEEVSSNGSRDSVTRELDHSEIVIGRGSTSNILLESRYLSLTHAKFLLEVEKLVVEDLGSLSGVLVNGKLVRRANVDAGDTVQFGDVKFKITREGGVWGAIERREEKPTEEIDESVARQLKALQIVNRLPRLTTISILLVALVAILFFVYPVGKNRWESWSSGPISNNHLMIANQCSACHGTPFESVKDERCTTCHAMTDHAPAFGPAIIEKHAELKISCVTCHQEHNGGAGLVIKNSNLCSNCHAQINKHFPDAKAQNVPRFEQHPEFTVMMQPPLPGGNYTRIRLDNTQELRDNSNVKLNHEKHLVTLNGPKGKVKLDCRSCHEPSEDLRTIRPISYVKHCQTCHGLEFDDRLPGRQVPHGDAEVVYKFLYAEYAKLSLSNYVEDKPAQEALNFVRGRPGMALPSVAEQPKPQEDFTREFVERESRKAEEQLFTRTACFLCHRIVPKDVTLQEASQKQVGLFTLLQPDIPNRWMPHSIFSHGAHEAVQCDECHAGVRKSSFTRDVLLPKVADCFGCHSEEGGHNTVQSNCVMCHSFHGQLTVPEDRKRSVKEILDTLR